MNRRSRHILDISYCMKLINTSGWYDQLLLHLAFSHKDASEECSVSNTNILVPNVPVTKEDHYYGYNSE
ncbi:hypothetical protein H5410_016517 [Solanum commersonii]|uniref:Uncharacterized protein n=1 Tax=Solanum commersonii TaxID=4109 RepID=A0A9J5ZWG3_SOLCO|nr:hypothetical protein H5410_016517 [Solanum commersonii]